MKRSSVLFVAVLLVGCGGGSESTTAVSSSPAPSDPGPSVSAAVGLVQGPLNLSCTQGEPMYWGRTWTLRYNGSATVSAAELEFETSGVTVQKLALPWQSFVETANAAGKTYTGTTVEGKSAWITVSDAGSVVGAGYKGSEAGDQLRCGVSRDGVAMTTAITQTNLVCGTYVGDVNRVPGGGWTLDTRGYPWTSFTADESVTEPVWEVTSGEDGRTATVKVYAGGDNTGSIYHLKDGQLTGYESPRSRNGGPPRVCWVPTAS